MSRRGCRCICRCMSTCNADQTRPDQTRPDPSFLLTFARKSMKFTGLGTDRARTTRADSRFAQWTTAASCAVRELLAAATPTPKET